MPVHDDPTRPALRLTAHVRLFEDNRGAWPARRRCSSAGQLPIVIAEAGRTTIEIAAGLLRASVLPRTERRNSGAAYGYVAASMQVTSSACRATKDACHQAVKIVDVATASTIKIELRERVDRVLVLTNGK